jgi:hypothetical protein
MFLEYSPWLLSYRKSAQLDKKKVPQIPALGAKVEYSRKLGSSSSKLE